MKKLPIGISNFELLIQRQNVYVDKTRLIYKMVDEGMFYFLSRPRRFGKSLLISTLRALFEGKRELFAGLWMENAPWEWEMHPVIVIDFNSIASDSPEALQRDLIFRLKETAASASAQLHEPSLEGAFRGTILALYRHYRQKVVVLVDEYDRPLVSHLGKGEAELEIARANREILRGFFGVLKDIDVSAVLRFVFITGISKFTQVSIFSGLNNLNDLTMHPGYGGLLGYTQEELEIYFQEYIDRMAKTLKQSPREVLDGLREWYNGYRFTDVETHLYNPFSILKALDRQQFGPYWFETATPAFLVNLIKERQYPIPEMEGLRVTPAQFTTY
ncbi:MAG: hypothetical protein D6681_04330, partial [Calditrichaeota bacterium]